MSELPFVACLCPTFRRPECLASVVEMWLRQDYPAERRSLVILDDAGQFTAGRDGNLLMVSTPQRVPSLQMKFNILAMQAGTMRDDAMTRDDVSPWLLRWNIGDAPDILVPWEDDDIYLPWHISAHVAALSGGAAWSRPSRVLTQVGSAPLREEPASGRFHGAWAFTTKRFCEIGSYDEQFDVAQDQGFDFDLGRRLSVGEDWWRAVDDSPADPCEHGPMSYVYHWGPAPYHGSGFGRDFYEKTGLVRDDRFIGTLIPRMDARTHELYERASQWGSGSR